MDVAAAIVRLLTSGAQISLTLQNLIQGTTSAPSLAPTICYEITNFRFVISKLQLVINGTTPVNRSRASLVDIKHLSFTLAGCVSTFSELEQEVRRLSSGGKFDFRSRLQWDMAEEKLAALIHRLKNHKLLLTLILTILTSASSAEAVKCKQTLDEKFRPASTHPTTATIQPITHPTSPVSPITITPHAPQTPSFYRDFESTLFNTRPYHQVPDLVSLSPAGSDRPKGTQSLVSRASNAAVLSLSTSLNQVSSVNIADASNTSARRLPIPRQTLPTAARHDKIGIPSPTVIVQTSRISPSVATNLHTASQYGNDEIAMRLLGQGADKDARDIDGHTPLHVASWHGRETTVLLLLNHGVNMHVRDVHGQMPLHLAALGGHDSVVQLLLGRGADREAKDVHGQVPLHHAALGGKDSTVQLLLGREVVIAANITRQRKRVQNVGRRAMTQSRVEREIRYSEVYGGKDLEKRIRHTLGLKSVPRQTKNTSIARANRAYTVTSL